jgi:hypothetical protein
MKSILKTMLRGCMYAVLSFCAVIFIAAGILEFTKVSSYVGFRAIIGFVSALSSVGFGSLALYSLGDKEN